VRRIIEIRSAYPTISREKIKATLENERIYATDAELEIVLNVFYPE
jgi:uncharacterized protein (DUF433 family)